MYIWYEHHEFTLLRRAGFDMFEGESRRLVTTDVENAVHGQALKPEKDTCAILEWLTNRDQSFYFFMDIVPGKLFALFSSVPPQLIGSSTFFPSSSSSSSLQSWVVYNLLAFMTRQKQVRILSPSFSPWPLSVTRIQGMMKSKASLSETAWWQRMK